MGNVAALGLDATEWTFVERLLAHGQMPNLAALRDRGLRCRFSDEAAYRSERPWTQFVTGRDPGSLGYWGPISFDPQTYRTVAASAFDGKPFWADQGIRSLVLDVPMTVLRDDVEGVQITAWGAHSPAYPRASSPTGLLAEVDRRFGPHPAFANDCDPGWYSPEYMDRLTEALCVGAQRRMDVLEWLLQRGVSYDFVVTTLSEPHSGGHHLWHGVDPHHPLAAAGTAGLAARHMSRIYGVVDECIGRFVRLVGADATVVVFAVHGMRTNGNDVPSMVLLPELLHRHEFARGLLRGPDPKAWRAAGMPAVAPQPDEHWIGYMTSRFADGPRDATKNLVKRAVPPPVLYGARRALGRPPWKLGKLVTPIPGEDGRDLPDIAYEARDPDYQIGWRYHRHWPAMRAFALPTFSDGHLRVNVRGRERHGVVDPADFRTTCDEVVELVDACRDPRTGEPVLADAVRMRDDPAEPGPPADLVLLWAGAPDAIEHPEIGTVGPFPYCRTGEHGPDGFAILAGPGIGPGDVGSHRAVDLPATLLALLGRSPHATLSGHPLPIPVPS